MSDATREPEFVSVLRAMGADDLCDTFGLFIVDSEGSIGADKIVSHITTLTQRVEAAESERDDYKRMYWDLWDSAKRHQDERKMFCVRADRAERILAAMRDPSVAIIDAATEAFVDYDEMWNGIRAAVAAAEKEVGA